MMEIKALDGKRLQALNHIIIQKKKKWLGPTTSESSFEERELIWKVVLPIGAKDRELGKWSPNWERPFKVQEVLPRNAYWLSSLEREPHKRFINGKYLKKYFPKMWEMLNTTKKN